MIIKNRKIESSLSVDINKSLRSLFTYLLISIGIFAGLYFYFVGAITFSIVKEKSIKQETKSLISSMSQEELRYFSLQKKMTREYANQIGLINAPRVSFADSQRVFAWNVGE